MSLAEEAAKRLSYNPETGQFLRLISAGGHRAGTLAGTINADGYRTLNINHQRVYAHRVAFLLMGYPLPGLVDHINGDPDDNRWRNLRAATKSDNAKNTYKTRWAQAQDAARYRWLRELPNADSLNVRFMGVDLDNVIDEAIENTSKDKLRPVR